jgi:hypothetical protein
MRSCSPEPPACEKYSEWTDFDACSANACGEEGKRSRKRSCLSGDGTCTKPLQEEEVCSGKVIKLNLIYALFFLGKMCLGNMGTLVRM